MEKKEQNRIEKPADRIYYVEPNDAYGKIDDNTVTPDYSDYCIYFNLIAERVSRVKGDITGENSSSTSMISWRSDLDNNSNYVKYIRGENIGTEEFLTSFYSDIHFNEVKEGKIVEGLGISNVNITFENYYTPLITVKFIDLRGSSLFGPEESVHSTYDGSISQETLFGSFFTFPYPKFTMVVKGFYGKPVTYQLACSDFRASFNSESGNFEATATFIGYQYSILTDIPMSFLVTAPECKYEGKSYWDEHVNSPDWAMDNGAPPIKLSNLIKRINNAIKNQDFLKNNDAIKNELETELYNSKTTEMAELNEIKSLYEDFYDDLIKINKVNNTIIYKENYYNSDIAIVNLLSPSKIYGNVEKWNKFINKARNLFLDSNGDFKEKYKSISNKMPSNFKFNETAKFTTNAVDIFGDEPINNWEKVGVSGGNKINNTLKDMLFTISPKDNGKEKLSSNICDKLSKFIAKNLIYIINDDKLESNLLNNSNNTKIDTVSNQSNEISNISNNIDDKKLIYLLYYKDNGFYDALKELFNQAQLNFEPVALKTENIEKKKYKNIEELLGTQFKPYIGNIYKIVMCHLETFVYMIYECTNKIQKQIINGDREYEKLGIKPTEVNVKRNTSNSVPPFPNMWNKGKKDSDTNVYDDTYDFLSWPGDFNGENEWEEKKLIDSIVDSLKHNQFLDITSSVNDEYKYFNTLPIFPSDLSKDYFPNYGINDVSNCKKYTALSGYLGLRANIANFYRNNENSATKISLFNQMGMVESFRLYKNLGLSKFTQYFSEYKDNLDEFKYKLISFSEDYGVSEKKRASYEYDVSKRIPIVKDMDDNYISYYYLIINDNNIMPYGINNYSDMNKIAPMIKRTINGSNENFRCLNFTDKTIFGKKYYGPDNIIYDYNEISNINMIYKGKYALEINGINEGNWYDRNKYVNESMFKIYYDKNGKYDSFIDYIDRTLSDFNNSDNNFILDNDITISNVDFSNFFNHTFKDSFSVSSANCPLNKKYIDIYNDKDYRYPTKNESISNIKSGLVSEQPVWWDKCSIKYDTLNKSMTDENGFIAESDNLVVQDFTMFVSDDENNKVSVFGSPLYYKINDALLEEWEKNYFKAFLFLHSVISDKFPSCVSISNEVFFEMCSYTDLLFIGGVEWMARRKMDNKECSIFKDGPFLTKDKFHFHNRMNSNLEFYNYEDYYIIDFKKINEANQLLALFDNFVKNEWPNIKKRCELSVRFVDEDNNNENNRDVIINMSEYLMNELINLINGEDTGLSRWKILSGNEDIVLNEYLNNFFPNYCDLYSNSYGFRMLLNEDNFELQDEIRKMLTKKVLVTTVPNKFGVSGKIKKEEYESYFNGFISGVKSILTKNENNDENYSVQLGDSRDLKIPIYNYLRNVWDKWLSLSFSDSSGDFNSNRFTVKNFFSNFEFIDTFYVNMFNKIHINCEILKSIYDNNPWESSLFKFLSDIASRHNCLFFALPDFLELTDKNAEENLSKLFTAIPYNEIRTGDLRSDNHFVVMLTYKPSENLNMGDSEYVYDGFDVYSNKDGNYVIPAMFNNKCNDNFEYFNGDEKLYKQRTRYGYNVPAFGVAFSRQDNHIFKNINISMANPMMTEQSIKAISNIVNKAQGNDKKVCFYGQDLYPIYSNNSYTCEIEMLGNAQITPLMYLQLMNIPMFRGAYMIFNVVHDIQPGVMTTKFKAMKMSKLATPYPSGWYMELRFDENGNLIKTDLNGENGSIFSTICDDISESGLMAQPLANGQKITSYFGEVRKNGRGTRTHKGIDVGVPLGSNVYACWDGKVISVGNPGTIDNPNNSGNWVRIKHKNGYVSIYMHLLEIPDNIKVGSVVKCGDIIGKSGGVNCEDPDEYNKFMEDDNDTVKAKKACKYIHGHSTGPHLHFQINKNGVPVNPLDYGFNFGFKIK